MTREAGSRRLETTVSQAASASAFPGAMAALSEVVRALRIDHAALDRPLSRCDLGRCRGACCHDGVYLDEDEVVVLEDVLSREGPALAALGAALPDQPIVQGDWQGYVSGPKTATRPAPMAATSEDYPPHFPDTACVLLLPDARCALQQLAIDQGLHPWHYKPATCWLHPLSIDQPGAGPPVLTLHDRETDPQRFPGYDGFASRTACGASPTSGGRPAWQTLAPELARLGEIAGRDLLGEIRAASGASITADPCSGASVRAGVGNSPPI